MGHNFSFCEGCETRRSCDLCIKLTNGVQEIKRGRWISEGRKLRCSVCGARKYLGTEDRGIHLEEAKIAKHCFNCGAVMEVDDG